jgi:hypothetical protein
VISDELRRRRVEVIEEHMNTEVTQEFDLTLATFNGHRTTRSSPLARSSTATTK